MADKNRTDQQLDEIENLSLEELQERIKEEKKNAKRSFLFAFTALVAIITVCIAWFVNNTQVKMISSNIAAKDGMNFELATLGKEAVIDTKRKPVEKFLEQIGGLIGESFSIGNDSGTVTGSGKASIQWNMSGGHANFANVAGSGQIDGTGDENIGLQPGAYGELTFYIIPKIDGAQTVNCTLHLTPYADAVKKSESVETVATPIAFDQDEKEVWEIRDERVKNVLNGHIYFFRDRNENGLYTSWLQPDENGTLHFSVKLDEKTKKDDPKEVVIYWNWPTLMSEVILKDRDQYLGSRRQLFAEKAQDEIVKFMCGDSNGSSFFFTSAENETGSIDREVLKRIHNVSWERNSDTFLREEYSGINQLYNNADQLLGKTVSYVSLELNATN